MLISLNKKIILIGTILAFLPLSVLATNYYVRKSGNDSNNGLTPATAWKTVTKAANYNLQPGDTVFIGTGIYNEQLVPSRSGSSTAYIVYYGDYKGLRTQDSPGRVTIGGLTAGDPVFVPQSASQNKFTFTLANIINNGDGTSTIKVGIRNNNKSNLKNTAISLPSGVTALYPANGSTWTSPKSIRYTINNPTSNPFYCIRYNLSSGSVYRGGSDTLIYKLTTQQAEALTSVRIRATTVNGTTGDVTLSVVYQPPSGTPYDIACKVNDKDNLVFQGITFGYVSNKAIDLFNTTNIVIRDCDTRNATSYGIYASSWDLHGVLTIESDSILSGNSTGISVQANTAHPDFVININNNYISDCGKGIELYRAYLKNGNINNNIIRNSSSHAIYIYQPTEKALSVSHNQISNVTSGSGLYLYQCGVQNLDYNKISNTGSHGMYISDATSQDVPKINTICNNEVSNVNNNCHGIYLDRVYVGQIANNLIFNITSHGIYANQVGQFAILALDSNLVYNCTGSGIYTMQTMSFNSVKGNTIYLVQNGLYLYANNYFSVANFSDNRIFSYSLQGIYCKYLWNTTIENNLVYGCTGSGFSTYGIQIYNDNLYSNTIKNNTVYNGGYYGIYGNRTTGSWRNNIVTGSTYGFRDNTGSGITATYNCAYNNTYNYSNITPGTGSITQNPLFVDPDGTDNILGGNNWLDDDLHIKSTGGSYHFGAWLYDDQDSPCLDAGDPHDDYSREPEDNGDRINIGCYGNTPQASKKKSACPMTAVYKNFPNNKWVMIGVPIAPNEGNPPGDPLAIFGDDFGGQMPNGTNWTCIHWVTEDSVMEYYEYGDGTIYQPPTPYPGLGYFVWQNTGAPVDVDVRGCPVDHCLLEVAQAPYVDWESEYGVALGFNQFANPYYFTIDWSNTEIFKYESAAKTGTPVEYTLAEAAAQGWISQYAYTWDHNLSQYNIVVPNANTHVDSISVWQGFYFTQIDSVSYLRLNIPNRRVLEKPSPISGSLQSFGEKYTYRSSSVSPDWDWFLKLGVVSKELKLQDTENGIGTAPAAKDGFDGLDALEMLGTDVAGNYLQFKFVIDRAPEIAYDLHAPFETSSTWKIQVETPAANKQKTAEIVWPQIRLVPQNLNFSLLASDNSTVLVEDLRAATSYKFKIKDELTTFYLKVDKVNDSVAPTFSFLFISNPLAPNDLTFFVIPSEPLESITATVNETPLNLNPVASPPNIYYGKYYISSSGSVNIAVNGRDASENSGSGSATMQVLLAKSDATEKITLSDGGIVIELPAGSLSEKTAVYAARCAMDLSLLDENTPIGEPLYIGPDNVKFNQKAVLHVSDLAESENVGLYRLTDGAWEFVGQYQNSGVPINSTGTYGFFSHKADQSQPDNTPLVFAINNCYPNPFNNTTMIRYTVETYGKVRLTVYNLLGQTVRNLVRENQPAGAYLTAWDGRNNNGKQVASGIYYLKMEVLNGDKVLFQSSKKLMLVK